MPKHRINNVRILQVGASQVSLCKVGKPNESVSECGADNQEVDRNQAVSYKAKLGRLYLILPYAQIIDPRAQSGDLVSDLIGCWHCWIKRV